MNRDLPLYEDQIFYSDDEFEHEDFFGQFVSSHSEIVTIASDSDIPDCNIEILTGLQEKEDFFAEDEKEVESYSPISFKQKKCWTCPNLTIFVQCNKCWQQKSKKRSRTSKPRRKKLSSNNTKTTELPHSNNVSDLCQLCCSNEKNAGFVHNNSVHYLTCYECSKTIFETYGKCPFCCRIIEKIVKIRS